MIKRTLYFGNPAYLSLRNGQMLLRLPEVEKSGQLSDRFKQEAVRTFPIEDLGVVVLDHSQITITQALLDRLVQNNCAVITCDSAHMPGALFLPMDGHSVQHQRFMAQLGASKPLCKQLWQQTVVAKIANQAAALKQVQPQCHVENMQAWSRQVRSDDADNLEARAAAYYWRNFFGPDSGFVREREGQPPNNLLNYGYAILRAVIARSLVGTGLLPVLGIHHNNKYNAFCLADDIMEPYRPFVDLLVKSVMHKQSDAGLTTDLKRDLLSVPTLDVVINGRRSPLMVAAETTTTSLLKCFTGEARRLIYPTLQ